MDKPLKPRHPHCGLLPAAPLRPVSLPVAAALLATLHLTTTICSLLLTRFRGPILGRRKWGT